MDRALIRLKESEPKQAEACQAMINFFNKYDDNISDAELAGILGVGLSQVKKLKFNARKSLRHILSEEDWYW